VSELPDAELRVSGLPVSGLPVSALPVSALPVHERPYPVGDELDRIAFHNMLECATEAIYFKDLQSRFIAVSRALGTLHGREPEELLGLTDFDLFTSEHASAAYADEQRVIATGISMLGKEECETWPDRGDTWVTSNKRPLRDPDGHIIGTFGISRDITRTVNAEHDAISAANSLAIAHADLSRVEAQLRTVLDTSADAISLYDANLCYQYLNAAAMRMTNDPNGDALGQSDRELGRDAAFLAIWESGLKGVLATGEGCSVDFSIGSGADLRWFAAHLAPQRESQHGTPIGVVASTREVTELKRAQSKLAHQALHDPLTGLANRVLLVDRLTQALLRMERQPGKLALLFIDLDHFKVINDTHGHDTGDRLLVEVGERLTAIARRLDTVARFGGDEFVLLCDKLSTDDDVRVVADRVVRAIGEPFFNDGVELNVTASVGVLVTNDPYAGCENVVRDADAAMYQAKERGRDHYQFFDAGLRDRAVARNAVGWELAKALERGQFRLEYQPVVSLRDRTIVGMEALIRWDHPERGTIPPAEFIGLAETRGLMVPIGNWVLDEACRQLVEWAPLRDPALKPLGVAVNVSGRQLRGADFVSAVKVALERNDLAPSQLCLEITETALIEETAEARETLEAIAALGVHIALDDFGTGYSSLAHLRQFPVDVLKIDRSFVDRLETNDRERQIVAAVTAMAHVLNMIVIAEGIETLGQLTQLTDLGCDHAQGYLLARPMRPEALELLLRAQESPHVASSGAA
jgi:diguanylate cyclase (GGDEF)-like protein/PAS domain S-box-containing protein